MKIKLFLAAVAAMVTMGANAQLTSGTVYWLQDTGTGQFLSQGDDWSTKAVMKDVGGLGFEAVYVSDGVYTLKNIMWNTVKNASVGLGDGQYVDQGLANYTITASGNGYKVSINGNYLVNNGAENAYKEKPIGTTTDASAATVFKFLTKTEYDAALQAYYDGRAAAMATSMGLSGITTLSALETEIAGADYVTVDQTSKINNPTIGSNWDGWTKGFLGNRTANDQPGVGSGCAEFWNSCGYAKQTVSGLPNGLYKITFVGTYRPESNTNAEKLVSEKTSSPAFVYANNDKKEFLHWIDVSAKANGRSGVTVANGYNHTFYTYVTNGTIELGVVADGWTGGNSWTPFGQFTLTQIYSLAMYQAMLDEVVAGVSAYNGIIPTAAYNAIQAVVATNNVTWSTAEEYTAAIEAINTAVATYATSDIQSAYTLVLEAKALVAQTDYTVGDTEKAAFQGYIDAADATTTLADLNTAINNIKSHVLDFATAVTFDTNAYFDLTNFLVVNPTVRQNTTGWSIDEIARNNNYSWAVVNYEECEFYQQQFKFYQSLTLPRGTWEFGVTGFHRAGNHSTYFYAGEDKILIPGVGSDVVNNMAGAKTYFDNGNGKVALKFALEDASSTIEIGIENRDTETDRWTIFRDFTLKFYGSAIDYSIYEANWSAAVTAANAAKTANSTVTVGSEYEALNAALANEPTGTSKADYMTKTTALTDATAAFTAAAPNYVALATEITKAKALGIDVATADSYAATSSTTAATALTSTQNLMVAEYTFVSTNYQYAVDIDPSNWTPSGDYGTMNSQHWSGNTSTVYYEQSSAAYGADSWNLGYTTIVSLPAGNYMFKVAGRKSSDNVTMTLTVTSGSTTLGTVSDFLNGDTGLGINKNGVTSFDADDEAGFSNKSGQAENSGTGWQWRYVQFTLSDPASVTLTVTGSATGTYQWLGFCNASLLTDVQDNVAIMEALVALTEATSAATLTQRTNVGTGVFQYDQTTDNSLWSAYSTAKAAAEAFTLAANTQVADVTALTTALTSAQTAYSNNNVLVAPSAATRYKLTLANKGALTFRTASTEGGYGMPFFAAADYMSQTFTLTPVSGETNTYTLSFEDFDGETRYVCTRAQYGEGGTGTAGIRTFANDNEKEALKIQIQAPSATANVFYMLNTENSNAKLGATNDGDFYTDATNSDWSIAEATEASVTVAAKAGKYGTVIFPFTPDVSTGFDGVTFYSCAAVNSDSGNVQLAEVAAPAANVPYLIKNDGENDFSKTLTGWGMAAADSYTEGLLTGVYTEATIVAAANNYVLQTQEGVQAFYLVQTSDFTATANKCYLTYEAPGAVKALYFDFGGETAIKGVEAATNENAVIYNLAGQRVSKAQKGLYIVNGKKVSVK